MARPNTGPRRPLFLARASYRRRRLRDAARLLPVVGLGLVVLPLFLVARTDKGLAALDVIYLFGVWLSLIAVAAIFAAGLGPQGGRDTDED